MLARHLLLASLTLLACSRSPSPAPSAAPPPSAPEQPGVAAPHADPASPPAPAPERAVTEALELPPGDPSTPSPLAASGETVVDPGARFRVVLAGACRDARLLILDAAGAAVPASETSEIGATTVLSLAPAAALTPGSRYQLRLDGATGRELHIAGRAYPPSRYALRAAGDPPPPAPKPAPKAKKRSRRH